MKVTSNQIKNEFGHQSSLKSSKMGINFPLLLIVLLSVHVGKCFIHYFNYVVQCGVNGTENKMKIFPFNISF